MEKVKDFLNKRSKVSLLVFLISIIVGILLIFEITNYSDYIRLIAQNTYESEAVLQMSVFAEFNIFICSLFVFTCLFNIVGYLYNNSEFMLISTGLYIILFCISMYMLEVSGVIFVACLLLLNLLGYVDQIKLINKKK